MTTCERARESLSAHLDGVLSGEDRTSLEAHVQGCEDCRRALGDLRLVVHRLSAQPLPEGPDLVAGVRRKLQPAPLRLAWSWPSWHVLAVAGSAAAVMLLVVSPGFKLRRRASGDGIQLAQYSTQAQQLAPRMKAVRQGSRMAYEAEHLKQDMSAQRELAKELGFADTRADKLAAGAVRHERYASSVASGAPAMGAVMAQPPSTMAGTIPAGATPKDRIAGRLFAQAETSMQVLSNAGNGPLDATALEADAAATAASTLVATGAPAAPVDAAPAKSSTSARAISPLVQLRLPAADAAAAAQELIVWVEAQGGFAVQTMERRLAIKLPPAAVAAFAQRFPDAQPTDPSAALWSAPAAEAAQTLWVSLSLELAVPK